MATGELLYTFEGSPRKALSVSFSPDGQILALGSADGIVRLWSVSTGQLLNTFVGNEQPSHPLEIWVVAFNRDGTILVSGGGDGSTIQLWDVKTGQRLRTLSIGEQVYSLVFSPDGHMLLSGAGNGIVRLWNVDSGQLIREIKADYTGVNNAVFSPDGRKFATVSCVIASINLGCLEVAIKLWDTNTGEFLQPLGFHKGSSLSIAFSPDGLVLISAGEADGVQVLDTSTGRVKEELDGFFSYVWSVTISPDGHTLAETTSGIVLFWDISTRQILRKLEKDNEPFYVVTFSPDGHILATATSNGTIRLWDLSTYEVIRTLEAHAPLDNIVFSPDGKMLASAGEIPWDGQSTLCLWNTATGQLLYTLKGSTAAFSPDGETIVSNDNNTVLLYDVNTGELLRKFNQTDRILDLTFNSDSRTIAIGSGDHNIHLWDVATGQPLSLLTGHTNSVGTIVFSPNGRLLASAALVFDNTVRFWETGAGQLLYVLEGHVFPVSSLAFSPDGRLLASGSEDGTARLWGIPQP